MVKPTESLKDILKIIKFLMILRKSGLETFKACFILILKTLF